MRSYSEIMDGLAAILQEGKGIRPHIEGVPNLLAYLPRTTHEKRLHESFCSALAGLEVSAIEHEGELFGPQLHIFEVAEAKICLIEPEQSKSFLREQDSEEPFKIRSFPRHVMVAATSGAVISTEWPDSLMDYALEHIFFHNQSLVCLEPVNLGAQLKLQVRAIGPLAERVPAWRMAHSASHLSLSIESGSPLRLQ